MAMNYILMPSLKCRALITVVTNLWNQDDVWASTLEFALPILQEEAKLLNRVNSSDRVMSIAKIAENRIRENRQWLSVKSRIIAKMEKLLLPKSLHQELLNFIKPISMEILGWKVYHYYACDIDFEVACGICWTQHGTVDQKKTAQRLIRDERLYISTRYQLACVCCLESDIEALWNQLSEYDKEIFYRFGKRHFKQHLLVTYWTCVIKAEMSGLKYGLFIKFPQDLRLLKKTAMEGNKAATEYFLQKLTPKVKKESLLPIATEVLLFSRLSEYNYSSDIICFLLSQMDEEQRIHLFERYADKILLSFVNWPYQSFFMEAAKHAWEFLNEVDFMHLLHTIVLKVICGFKDYDYQKLFKNFWLQSPISKENVCRDSSLILRLFDAGDKGNVKLLLKDAALVEKEFIFSPHGKNICSNLISTGDWDSLRFLVGECISSKELIVRFREQCEECQTTRYFSKSKLVENGDAREKFLQILDDFSHILDKKRRTEEADGTVAKRLFST